MNCEPVRLTGTGAIGIDFGTLTAIAMSNGTKIENPKFLAKTQAKIRKASQEKRRKRALNRKQKIKASRRYQKAQLKASKLIRKAARQRLDWAHKRTTEIVRRNSLVVSEN